MSSDIRIRKGLDIQLEGKAEAITKVAPLSQVYGLRPAEFHRVIPKLIAREGATVKFWKSELLPMLSSLFMNMKRSK